MATTKIENKKDTGIGTYKSASLLNMGKRALFIWPTNTGILAIIPPCSGEATTKK